MNRCIFVLNARMLLHRLRLWAFCACAVACVETITTKGRAQRVEARITSGARTTREQRRKDGLYQSRPQSRPGHPDDETSYDVLGAVDHALQNSSVPAEELYRETVFISSRRWAAPTERGNGSPVRYTRSPYPYRRKTPQKYPDPARACRRVWVGLGGVGYLSLFSRRVASHRTRSGLL